MNIPYVFVDRDGTIIKHIPYLSDPKGVALLPGAREGLKMLKSAGCRLFLHTNQSGVGRGFFSLEQALACNHRMLELLALGEDLFDDVCVAPERPDQVQAYRKPSPRFAEDILRRFGARAESVYYIGDSVSDLLTAVNVGGTGLGVDTGDISLRDQVARSSIHGRTFMFHDFFEAAGFILTDSAQHES